MSDYSTRVTEEKQSRVEELRELFKDGKGYIFTDYRGLTVEQITKIRNELREKNAVLKVIKNRYAKIAFSELEISDLDEILKGPTAVAIAHDDAAPVAKVLYDYVKETPVKVKAGIIEGKLFGPEEVEAFSKLPSRLELIAMLMSAMNAPAQNFVYALNGVTTKLVRTLQAVADKKSEG
ncbi:50S ribosomal protein L10 [Spirochaetia bacterium 38H-sp]|uniref:Large ribosomal subunit protein uL10 n=1 Tax=Rarispira pelagica TaxID=3141764 RepID=A0ABU9UFG6_9SPIR